MKSSPREPEVVKAALKRCIRQSLHDKLGNGEGGEIISRPTSSTVSRIIVDACSASTSTATAARTGSVLLIIRIGNSTFRPAFATGG